MKEHLEFLDSLHVNLTQGGMLLVNFILAFVMFGVALGIKAHTFKAVFKKPTSVIIGMIAQWIALPALTCLLAIVLNPIITPMVAIGMILVSSCPGGNMSNLHIGILVQDTRALASEFKHHRGDVPCGGGHYLAAKFGATREENDIETLVQ